MRRTFAHEAELLLDQGVDEGAPGAAITASLCGSWDHPGPCPLAPHHTSVRRDGARLHIRVLFAAEPDREDVVRRMIVAALSSGGLAMPDGDAAHWQVVRSQTSEPAAAELEHAARLAAEQ